MESINFSGQLSKEATFSSRNDAVYVTVLIQVKAVKFTLVSNLSISVCQMTITACINNVLKTVNCYVTRTRSISQSVFGQRPTRWH